MTPDEPFADLPDALVRDLLDVALPVANHVKVRIQGMTEAASRLRRAAEGLIRRKADLERPREPSVAAVDGSYQIHTLTSIDLCAAAAIAVEGSVRNASRYWPEPYHRMWADGVPHATDATGVLRALMVSMELELAAEAPHDLVLLDGSLGSLIIYLNQGLTAVSDVPETIGNELRSRWYDQQGMERLLDLLHSDRTVAVPKFTARNELLDIDEIAIVASDIEEADGRTLATVILQPGEYTQPLPGYRDRAGESHTYHLPDRRSTQHKQDLMNAALQDVRVTYFRPYGWVPALRLEIPGAIAISPTRLSMALEGIESQFFSPAVVEPYPLFMADRMVKSLGAGISVVEQTVAQRVVDGETDVQTAMLCMQNYRTQGGRGGTA